MSPSGIITFTILIVPILLLLVGAFFWRKGRIVLLLFALAVASAEVYYLLYAQEASVQEWYENEAVVDAYLTEKYPDDDWVIRRQNKSSFFTNTVEVIFVDEVEVVYMYQIENDEVMQVGFSMKDGYDYPKRER